MTNIILAVLLFAIGSVESGNDDYAVSRTGDRGRFQISAAVWAEHSARPHTYATNRVESERVARAHIERCIVPEIRRRGLTVTVFRIAGSWNGGPRGHLDRGRSKGYAARVEAMYKVRLRHKPCDCGNNQKRKD